MLQWVKQQLKLVNNYNIYIILLLVEMSPNHDYAKILQRFVSIRTKKVKPH